MKTKLNTEDKSPIVFYNYFDLSDPSAFCDCLAARFRESGHERPIEFHQWNCYNDPPGRDGDIYCYDGYALTSLVDEGYIRQLPDIIDTSKVFEWILDRSRIRNKIYGIPFITCASVLIGKEGENLTINNVFDLPEGFAAPMKSMVNNFYIYSLCNYQDRREEVLKTLRQLKKMMGPEAYQKSKFAVYDGIERFNRGDCQYLIGFTEDIRKLNPGRYTVQLVNFSDGNINEMPLFSTDFASVGKHVSGEKLLDCIDLLELISDSDFLYDVCTTGGKLQYMLPADQTLYPRLAELDPIYHRFYEIVSNENNGVLRYGKHFFTDYPKLEIELLELLEEADR